MKVIVLGSGVVGITTAYYLARQGHEVEVVDRQPGPALETSFANAGEVSPGYSAPWAGPGVPLKAIKWLLMRHGPLVIRPRLDPAMWAWLAKMLGNCTLPAYERNKGRMVRLAEYSRDALRTLRHEAAIAYDERSLGTLQLFRTEKQVEAAQVDMAILDRFQVPYRLLDRAGCVAAEPGLAPVADKIAGGLQLPGDETGDCFKFTQSLARIAETLGVRMRYNTAIQGLIQERGRISGVRIGGETITGDAYVVALGSYSPQLVRELGLRLPVYPVKGYSITMPIVDEAFAPVSTIMDETHKVAITRLGDRIRAAGTAELAGYDLTLREGRRAAVTHVVADLFPQGGDPTRCDFWTGLRPMTPDGTPVVGPTALPNLFLNTGHGTLGWTMACGSARVLADLMSGRQPEIDAADLALSRYDAPARPHFRPRPAHA